MAYSSCTLPTLLLPARTFTRIEGGFADNHEQNKDLINYFISNQTSNPDYPTRPHDEKKIIKHVAHDWCLKKNCQNRSSVGLTGVIEKNWHCAKLNDPKEKNHNNCHLYFVIKGISTINGSHGAL
jgi:hypothetical protein